MTISARAQHMDPPPRGRSRHRFAVAARLFVVLVLLAAIVEVPVAVARHVTAPQEPISFRSHPWQADAFIFSAIKQSIIGDAGSPAAALNLARSNHKLAPRAAGVRLVYVPSGTTLRLRIAPHRFTRVAPTQSLVWIVSDRGHNGQPALNVALLSMESGTVTWMSPALRAHTQVSVA